MSRESGRLGSLSTRQAGELLTDGRYALFGCTMAPGFNAVEFEAGLADELAARYPQYAEDIRRLSVRDMETRLPQDFEG